MGYKLLGYMVWHGGKWYLRRRDVPRKAAIAGVAGAALVGVGSAVAVGQRRGD